MIPAADVGRARKLVGRHEHFNLAHAEHTLLLTHSAKSPRRCARFAASGSIRTARSRADDVSTALVYCKPLCTP